MNSNMSSRIGTQSIDIDAYRIQKTICALGHEFKSAKFMYVGGSPICFQCLGKDISLSQVLKIFEGKAQIIPNDILYDTMFELYPETKDARNCRYVFECKIGHEWESTFGRLLEGNWCNRCLTQENFNAASLDGVAKRNGGRCITSAKLLFDFESDQQFICYCRHIFFARPIDIIRGFWCNKCHDHVNASDKTNSILTDDKIFKVVKSRNMTPQSTTITNLDLTLKHINDITSLPDHSLSHLEEEIPDDLDDIFVPELNTDESVLKYVDSKTNLLLVMNYGDIKNKAFIRRFECDKGHRFYTAAFLLYPEKWCPECDPVTISMNRILKNVNGSAKLEETLYPNKSFDEFNYYWASCEKGHEWLTQYCVIMEGKWCPRCLSEGYGTVESYKMLAKQFKGRYIEKENKWICQRQRKVFGDLKSVLRGNWCTYDCCADLNNHDSAELLCIRTAMRDKLTVHDKIAKLKLLDKDMLLTHEEVEEAVRKYPLCLPEQILLRAKYNTIAKLKDLASSFGGSCLNSEFVSVSSKYTWTCGKKHDGENFYQWDETLDAIFKGSWCRVCRYENSDLIGLQLLRGIIGLPQDGLSKGNWTCRKYFKKRGISFVPEKSYADLSYINRLRFDFYIPSLNCLVEFDGKQHFVPVEHFGGIAAFKIQVEKDNMKANYCMKNKIRLLRINNVSRVESDLDKLLADTTISVMYIAIDAKFHNSSNGYFKSGSSDYLVKQFSV